MRIEGERESDNIEDRRGMPIKGIAAGGGGIVMLIIVLIALFTGKDPTPLLQQVQQQQQGSPGAAQGQVDPAEEPLRKFVAVVLADTEDVWGELFPKMSGQPYPRPKLVLFTGRVDSACGMASAAAGPFYCPGDQKVYLDLAFFKELQDRFKAPGDFAMAYVVAHEVGHHVQNLLGLSDQVHEARSRLSDAEYNEQSVRLELQADYLAGVWAHHAQRTKQMLESGDIEEALRAANAIGDDTLQKQAQGYVVPDAFTHGTSAQRVKWFRAGFDSGDLAQMKQLFDLPYNRL
ncbi:MAG TPA: neutral zinc metallopeptidase [Tepidisphaeraceae bacterium]|nr:neutral zinc metallopeptidase [Tepidisphaeraceae bacterium]